MSKTTTTAGMKKKSAPAKQRAEVGTAMFGRDILVEALEREGVEVIFAYPGGASMEIHQSLTKSKIRTILPRHEQGGSFAAEGYARATGKAGVCMGTSGPGATNLVTAIADAYMDSCPLIAITGQVTQNMIGRGAFQETDIIGVTLPIVKHSYLVTDVNDIPRIVKEAFYIAQIRPARPGGHRYAQERAAARRRSPSGRRSSRSKQVARLQPAGSSRGRPRVERDHGPDREGRAPGALLWRRHHHRRCGGGTQEVRRSHATSPSPPPSWASAVSRRRIRFRCAGSACTARP